MEGSIAADVLVCRFDGDPDEAAEEVVDCCESIVRMSFALRGDEEDPPGERTTGAVLSRGVGCEEGEGNAAAAVEARGPVRDDRRGGG